MGGTEIYINVLDVQLPKVMTCSDVQDLKDELFMKYLGKEYSQGTVIHGLPKDSYIKNCSGNPKYRLYKESEESEECIKVPYPYSVIKLEIIAQGGLFSQFHLLVGRVPESHGLINFTNFKDEFVIGRHEEGLNNCDISLN